MNYHTEITLTTPTPEQWTAYLVAHAQELGLPHLDLLLDCANIHPAIFNPFIPLRHSLQQQDLLALTPHDSAAQAGPMLIRVKTREIIYAFSKQSRSILLPLFE